MKFEDFNTPKLYDWISANCSMLMFETSMTREAKHENSVSRSRSLLFREQLESFDSSKGRGLVSQVEDIIKSFTRSKQKTKMFNPFPYLRKLSD